MDFPASVLVAHYVAHLASAVHAAHFSNRTTHHMLVVVAVVHA